MPEARSQAYGRAGSEAGLRNHSPSGQSLSCASVALRQAAGDEDDNDIDYVGATVEEAYWTSVPVDSFSGR